MLRLGCITNLSVVLVFVPVSVFLATSDSHLFDEQINPVLVWARRAWFGPEVPGLSMECPKGFEKISFHLEFYLIELLPVDCRCSKL